MRVSFIGHASILVEADGKRIISDPWWAGPCFGMQWWPYPVARADIVDGLPPDYIYISHGHADHLHNGTLSRLPKSAICLVAEELGLAEGLKSLGFDVVEIPRGRDYQITDMVRIEILPTINDDSLAVIDDGDEVCINLNDALHSAPRTVQADLTAYLNNKYGQPDYVYCGYGIASHFPACIDVPDRDAVATVVERQKYFNRQWAYLVHQLSPRFAFPFAADVAFLDEKLRWANEAIHNGERPVETLTGPFASPGVTALDIAPGFVIADGQIEQDVRAQKVSDADIERVFGADIEKMNRPSVVEFESVQDLAGRISKTVDLCRDYLCEVRADYRFLIVLEDCEFGIEVRKASDRIDVTARTIEDTDLADFNVLYRTRYAYLRRALSDAYGYEVLSVGSGGVFTYRSRVDADRNLHTELLLLLRSHKSAPRSRYGDQSRLMFVAKTRIKAAINLLRGRKAEPPLYDNRYWIKYRA